MPLVSFVKKVVDRLNVESNGWMAAIFHQHIEVGRYWAMVYRNSWPVQRSRAALINHELYNPAKLNHNNHSPHLWFEIASV
jgi:hypothetical protein